MSKLIEVMEGMLKDGKEFLANKTEFTPPQLLTATIQNIYLLTELLAIAKREEEEKHSPIVKDEWISVEDNPPQNPNHYLCHIINNTESTVQFSEYIEVRYYVAGFWSTRNNERITHYMPLPPAPSKGEAQ